MRTQFYFTLGASGRNFWHRHRPPPAFRFDHSKHILEVALEWKQQLSINQHISSADIATQAGITSGQVRQILRFTNLHPEVQKHVLELVKLQGRKAIPERLLRQLQQTPYAKQAQRFEQLLMDR